VVLEEQLDVVGLGDSPGVCLPLSTPVRRQ
jgi:hypothetical protein